MATSKGKVTHLTDFFSKIPRNLPLSECSNTRTLDCVGKTELLDSASSNKCTNKLQVVKQKRNHDEENLSSKKKPKSDHNLTNSPSKLLHQKTIDEFNLSNFGDEFFQDIHGFEDAFSCDLELSKLDRYRVENVEVTGSNDINLTLENLVTRKRGACVVKSPWNACVVHTGDIISIQGRRNKEPPSWIVDWDGGILVTNSDHLISGTTVVNSLYCPRKTVLSHIFKEQDCSSNGNKAMFIGCVVHQLLQEALSSKMTTLDEIKKLFDNMKNSEVFKTKLFYGNYSIQELEEEITHFIPRIYNFICKFVNYDDVRGQVFLERISSDWQGEIVGVRDIEENIWSHRLGVKGKVDATLRVKVRNKIKLMPLELKTGKVAPLNLEHRGQVILYCMMLQEMGENVDSGLLLYLRDEGQMIDVKFAEKEKRDLILLRNGLSGWLKNLSLVEAKSNIPPPVLPRVINRNTCQSCPQLVACSSALRMSGDIERLKENNVHKTLASDSTKHLTDQHLNYVFHWLGLLSMEFQMSKFSLSRIWTYKPQEREAKGWCFSNMEVKSSSPVRGGRWEIVFVKTDSSQIFSSSVDVGQCIVVGNDSHIAIAMGSVIELGTSSITVILDKDMKSFSAPMYIDIYESSSINVILMNNLGILLVDNEESDSLRKLVIDLKVPSFSPKLSSKIKKVGSDIFDRLNKEQVRALLQAMAADKYILIKGLPGAGKTTTMRALIELLVRLGKKVLVTSFTHSAIDNILLGLPLLETGDILRLGPTRRINPLVACHASEENIMRSLDCNQTSESLENAYNQKKVIGVTCLGCGHPWLERQKFDVCLVDEATQVTQPAVLKPISLAKKFILVGDPKQLPPLVLCDKSKENGMAVSLFEKLDRPAVTSCLTLQYRMNSFITNIANKLTYDGQLKCGNDQVAGNVLTWTKNVNIKLPDWLNLTLNQDLEKSVVVLDVKNLDWKHGDSYHNKAEAKVVSEIIIALKQININLKTIGVIAAYREQVNLLKDMLDCSVEINTVDQYQGRDKDIIIFSTTKSSALSVVNDVLGDHNRLTVAVTRAKKKLIIIGNIDILRNYTNFNRLFSLLPTDNIIKYHS